MQPQTQAPVQSATLVLDDLLIPGLRLVFIGTAAGHTSAARKAYYAGPGNKFWRVLADLRLTPRQLDPAEYRSLLSYGIGLTDIAKHTSGNDSDLRASDFDAVGLQARIEQAAPGIVAFNGKKAASLFLRRPPGTLSYGTQAPAAKRPLIFILPSTSGAAGASWALGPWQELATAYRGLPW